MFKKIFGVLQKVGKALMLPVAILPAAGILLGFGNAFQNPQLTNVIPALKADWFVMVAKIMEQSGDIIFANLALLFAVGVAIGLAGGDGVAGLAAFVGYLIMNKTMSVFLEVDKLVKVTSSGADPVKLIYRSSICKRIRNSNATNRSIWWYYRRDSSGILL